MNRFIISALVLSAVTANAQVKNGMVGINTDEPRATMHIEPGVSESKGLIIPRITAAQMKTMTNLAHFGADHHAIITYLKEQLPLADRTGKLVDVADPGYYYYDNTTGVQKWKTFGGGAEQDFKAIPTSSPGFYNYLTKGAGVLGQGTSLGTGYGNIGIGGPITFNFANSTDMTGNNNIALGVNTFQFYNGGTMSSNSNIGIGKAVYSLFNSGSITGSGNNIGMGSSIYRFNKANAQFSGWDNTSIGQNLFSLDNGDLTGHTNIGMGNNLYTMRSGDMASNNNVALGSSIYTFTKTSGAVFTGAYNTSIGQDLFTLHNGDFTGNYNIGMGNGLYILGSGYMEGNNNIGIGQTSYYIVHGNITSSANNNISLGNSNYRLNSSSLSTFSGQSNIGIGYGLYNIDNNFSGKNNIGMGTFSFSVRGGSLTGDNNIGIGNWSLGTLGGSQSGNYNISLGEWALFTNSGGLSGSKNIGIGYYALYTNGGGDNAGDNNIAIGEDALRTSSPYTGSNNIAIGKGALQTTQTRGSYNIGIGDESGRDLAEGNGNIHIGNSIMGTNTAGQLDNVVAIGHGISPASWNSTDNVILLGNNNTINAPKIGMGTYNPQAKLDVNGGVRVGQDSSTCSYINRGTIRFETGTNKFQGCDGSNWVNLH